MGKKLTAKEIGQHVISSPSTGFDQCVKCQGIEVQGEMRNLDDSKPFDDELICDECIELEETHTTLVDKKFSEYLTTLKDQASAGMLREAASLLPEDKRRELIIKHLPEMKINCRTDEDTHEEEKEWNVPVMRTAYGHRLIAVSARSEQEAINKAIDEAGGESFSENSSEYTAPDGAHLIQ